MPMGDTAPELGDKGMWILGCGTQKWDEKGLPTPKDTVPHTPHLMRMPAGRTSSSLAFLMFLSTSSEDLGEMNQIQPGLC